MKIPKYPTLKDVPKRLTVAQAKRWMLAAKKPVTECIASMQGDYLIEADNISQASYRDGNRRLQDAEVIDTVKYWERELLAAMRYYMKMRDKIRKAEELQ